MSGALPAPAPEASPSSAARPLRERLRAETREAHERVDRAFLHRFDLSTREGMAAFLAVHARVLPPLERALEAAGAARLLPDWPLRRRTRALRQDLAGLASPWPAHPIAAPELRDDAESLGALYVLEGSRLGGAVLARRAAASSDPSVRAATRYLMHGQHLRLWPSFTALLNADAEAAARPDRVLASALLVFAAFELAIEDG